MKNLFLVILSVLFMTSCKKENLSPLNGEYTLMIVDEYGNLTKDTLGQKMIFDNTDVCIRVGQQKVNSYTYGDTLMEVHREVIWRLNGDQIQFKSRRGESWKYASSLPITIMNGQFYLGNNSSAVWMRM